MPPHRNKLKTSKAARSQSLLGMVARLAKKEVAHRVEKVARSVSDAQTKLARLQTQVEQAQILVQNLKQLRGAAMKAGQLLSLELRDQLPPEVAKILSELQSKSESLPFESIEPILREELPGAKLGQRLQVLPEAFASASIGQVHRAEWEGQKLALKIQFPGVREAIRSDLELLRKTAKALLFLAGKTIDTQAMFRELGDVLLLEADYEEEARALKRYGELLAQTPSLKRWFGVPGVVTELSTRNVLAMEFVEGLSFDDWLRTNPSRETRQGLAAAFLELYFAEYYRWGFVQTDPNLGNFRFAPQPGQDPPVKVWLLDFGAMKSFDAAFRKLHARFLLSSLEGPRTLALELTHELGLLSPEEAPAVVDAFFAVMDAILSAFLPENQPFAFARVEYVAETQRRMIHFMKALKRSPPPRTLLFLHRKLSGVFAIAKALGAELDLQPYWKLVREEAQR